MDLDYSMMLNLMEVELNLKELEAGHKQKYFSKNTKRKWSFNCHHCEEKVASNEADEYFIVSITWKYPSANSRRFCSRNCSDIYFREQQIELLTQREQIIKERKLLREFYGEAEQKFLTRYHETK